MTFGYSVVSCKAIYAVTFSLIILIEMLSVCTLLKEFEIDLSYAQIGISKGSPLKCSDERTRVNMFCR